MLVSFVTGIPIIFVFCFKMTDFETMISAMVTMYQEQEQLQRGHVMYARDFYCPDSNIQFHSFI